jgi:hypothetical protein
VRETLEIWLACNRRTPSPARISPVAMQAQFALSRPMEETGSPSASAG